MRDALRDRCKDAMRHLCALTGVGGCVVDAARRKIVEAGPGTHFCARCACPRCQRDNAHLYGVNEAYRWDGQSFYYCPMGLTFAASCVSDERGALAGGVVLGPLVMGRMEDALAELSEARLIGDVLSLPVYQPAQVTHLAYALNACAALATGQPRGRLLSAACAQDKLLEAINAQVENGAEARPYPIEVEKALQRTILAGDRAGAQGLLNQLLAYIYCANEFKLGPIKERLLELIVVLSRATIDAGADMGEIFLYNAAYRREIERFDSLEDLSVWLTGVMQRFIQYSFDFQQVKHADVVFKAMQYMRRNCAQKVSLDDVARHVYLSRAYLSTLFKEETGQSLFAYLTQVRVEKGKRLLEDQTLSLAQVAVQCGFEDQSYFSKIFKRETGMSPKKYRDSRGVQRDS